MKGSLQKKRDKYYVVVYQKDENGKLRQKWIPTGISSKGRNQTKADAALHRILTELEAQNAKSTSFLVTKLKFVEALLAWVEYKKYEIRTNTYELYTLNLNKHIMPFFEKKNKLVTEITIDDIEDHSTSFFVRTSDGRHRRQRDCRKDTVVSVPPVLSRGRMLRRDADRLPTNHRKAPLR